MSKAIKQLADNLRLGEGCIWDHKRKQVHFVDIEGFKICSYDTDSGEITTMDMGDYVGCIVLDANDNLVAAVRNQLIRIYPESKEKEILMRIPFSEALRFNDGKCDSGGNLWIGTMAIDQAAPEAFGAGSLYCVKNLKVIARYDGFTIANGMDFSCEGNQFYHIDTQTQKIDGYEISKEGELLGKRTVVRIPPKEGSPDGMCVDADGYLWVAMWGGFRVNCYHPVTGEKLQEISLPDQNVSCCAFGGTHLDELYVTTAQDEAGCGGGLYRVPMQEKKGKPAYRLVTANFLC